MEGFCLLKIFKYQIFSSSIFQESWSEIRHLLVLITKPRQIVLKTVLLSTKQLKAKKNWDNGTKLKTITAVLLDCFLLMCMPSHHLHTVILCYGPFLIDGTHLRVLKLVHYLKLVLHWLKVLLSLRKCPCCCIICFKEAQCFINGITG